MKLKRHPLVERTYLRLKTAKDWMIARLVEATLYLLQKLPPERSTDLAERVFRRLAPILPRTALARRNMTRAFPQKSEAEINALISEMWGNFGRALAEYVFLDQLFDFDPERPGEGRVEFSGIEHFLAARDAEGPAILFTGHTGNWELLPIGAAAYEFNVTALFRPPNNRFLAKRVLQARRTTMGHLVPSRAGAAWALADVMEKGGSVGLLVDQHFTRGPMIEFFGHEARANPLLAKLARQFDCPVYPARCIRLPGGRFRIEMYEAINLPRNDNGEIDIAASTQMINSIVEDWVREYPAQWLWIHNRWRGGADAGKSKKNQS